MLWLAMRKERIRDWLGLSRLRNSISQSTGQLSIAACITSDQYFVCVRACSVCVRVRALRCVCLCVRVCFKKRKKATKIIAIKF